MLPVDLLRLHGASYDRYPPFTRRDVPDYLAALNISHPQQQKRWLPLVKSLLAFPHYILVARLSAPV